MIDKQITFENFIKQYNKDSYRILFYRKIDESNFNKMCVDANITNRKKDIKIAFNYLDESKDKKIDVKELKSGIVYNILIIV